jgi:predicted RNA-binding protein with RPS1 domain
MNSSGGTDYSGKSNTQAVRVFVSYSHDSDEHRQRVLEFSQLLRDQGIDAVIDQYEQSPPEGWPKWTDRMIREATFVLVVCTANYHDRFAGLEIEGVGRGVRWESLLTSQHIYRADSRNTKFIPIVFDGSDCQYVPTPLQGATLYQFPAEFEKLFRHLTSQPRVVKRPLGQTSLLKPEESFGQDESKFSRSSGQSDGLTTVATDNVNMDITIDVPFDRFTKEQREEFLKGVERILCIGHPVRIIGIRKGSTVLTLKLSPQHAEKLYWAIQRGELDAYRVIDCKFVHSSESSFPTEFAPGVGQIISARIVEIRSDEVLVDIGYATEGAIPISEFDDAEDLKVGDEIEVEKLETQDGMIVLSRMTDPKQSWDKILKVFQGGGLIKGEVQAVVEDGLMVDIGVEAFLPASEIDILPPQDLQQFVGKTYDFKIVTINLANKTVVLSRREIIRRELAEKRSKFLESVTVGDTMKGVVKKLTDFGAIIDLDAMHGFLHISNITSSRLTHPSELLKIGQEIDVAVLDIDKERQRVSLGLKQTQFKAEK